MALSINDIQQKDTQHNKIAVILRVFMLSQFTYCYAECRYAECRYAECRYAECRYAECRYAECRGASKCAFRLT